MTMFDIIVILIGLFVGFALFSYAYWFCMNFTGGRKLLSSVVAIITVMFAAFLVFILSLTF